MMKYIFLVSLLIGLVACESPAQTVDKTALKSSIKALDDSIYKSFKEAALTGDYAIDAARYERMIQLNIDYYENFPDDEFAETCLDKIAGLYLQIEKEDQAVLWRDTLLQRFPDTKRKMGLLELQMNYYDFNQYDPAKIQFYADRLLALEKLPATKREMIEFRLAHLDMTFDELIFLQSQLSKDTLD